MGDVKIKTQITDGTPARERPCPHCDRYGLSGTFLDLGVPPSQRLRRGAGIFHVIHCFFCPYFKWEARLWR